MVDIRDPKWFGQLRVSGQKPIDAEGSISSMAINFVARIRTLQARPNSTGRSVTMRFQDSPFTSAESIAADDLINEIESGIQADATEDNPRHGETAEVYITRLVDAGYDQDIAYYLGAQWFPESNDSRTLRLSEWLNDPQAQRFRQLNASNAAYSQAMPSEYESLKRYVKSTYPDFTSSLTFRTA